MSAHTYYVALPFKRSTEGHLVAGEAQECACAESAASTAEELGGAYVGAIAFARSIDAASGTCSGARLLRRVGDLPNLGYLLNAS